MTGPDERDRAVADPARVASGRRTPRQRRAGGSSTRTRPSTLEFSAKKSMCGRRRSKRSNDHDDLPAGLTTILPTMYGWIVQIYGYSPGAAKVWENVSSVSSAADLNVPFSSPILCGLSSSFFQVTVVPAVTVRVAGVKAKLSI